METQTRGIASDAIRTTNHGAAQTRPGRWKLKETIMGLKAKAKAEFEKRELVPAKRYRAVVIGVCDIGTHLFTGKDGAKRNRQLVFIWELHGKKGPALDSKGEVFTISRFYTLSFGKNSAGIPSNLRRDLGAMRGSPFSDDEAHEGVDVEDYVESACILQVEHVPSKKKDAGKDDKWANISSFMPLDEDDEKPETVLDSFYYEIDPDREIPSDVPKWLHSYIEKSDEWVKVHGQPKPKEDRGKPANPLNGKASTGGGDSDDDDDIPF